MSADNMQFDVTGGPMKESLMIAFLGAPGGKATHYRVDQKLTEKPDDIRERDSKRAWYLPRLVLGWHEFNNSIQLPASVRSDDGSAQALVESWLKEQDYGVQPDHDGDNKRGWRIYCESWGHVGSDSYTFVAIEPVWLVYGK